MAWLVINTFNGKDHYSIEFTGKKTGEYSLGTIRYISITDEEAALTIDKIAALYKEKQKVEQEIQNPTEEEIKEYERVKKAHDALVYRIVRIIKESHHKGEVESAKGFYLKVTGKEWKG